MNLRHLANRFRRGSSLWHWLPAGVYGGVAGGFAAAWLLWGGPRLLSQALCLLVKVPLTLLMLAFVATFGCTLVLMTQTLIRGIRHMRRPPISMYEPIEPIPELQLVQWPHPGCGLFFLVPIVLLSALFSLPWFWFAPRQVPVGRLLLSAVVGLPVGLAIARHETKQFSEHPGSANRQR
ncbi:MAG: hypothetical protein ACP5JG_08285 [Anaerolineae bacterium]